METATTTAHCRGGNDVVRTQGPSPLTFPDGVSCLRIRPHFFTVVDID